MNEFNFKQMQNGGTHYAVYGTYSQELGKAQYQVFKLVGTKEFLKPMGGKSWNFKDLDKAQAYADKLNAEVR